MDTSNSEGTRPWNIWSAPPQTWKMLIRRRVRRDRSWRKDQEA